MKAPKGYKEFKLDKDLNGVFGFNILTGSFYGNERLCYIQDEDIWYTEKSGIVLSEIYSLMPTHYCK